jgi:hypothetical protein
MFESTEQRLLYPYKQVLGTVSLSAEKRQIFEDRYMRLLEASYQRCRKIAIVYNTHRLLITVGSIIVPALLSIQHTDQLQGWTQAYQGVYWTTWLLSLLVSIANGMLTMFKFDRKYYLFHAVFEQLKTEGWQFLGLTGNYRGTTETHSHELQFGPFSHTVERIRMRQTEEEFIKLQEVAGVRAAAAAPLTGPAAAQGPIPTVFEYGKTPSRDDFLQTLLSLLKAQTSAQPLPAENSIVEAGDASESGAGRGRTNETAPETITLH